MDQGERAVVIVTMLAEAARALASELHVEPVICRTLAEGLGADVAACFAPNGSPGGHLVGYHPDPASAAGLLGALPVELDGGEARRLTQTPLGEVLMVLPALAYPTGGSPRRGLAFARRDGFGEHQVQLLREAVPPLRALLPHAVAAGDLRARAEAGRTAAREHGLTARELDVLELLSQGMLATSIASRLSLSPRTVHKHLGNLYDKLGVHDRLVAVSLARELGLVDG